MSNAPNLISVGEEVTVGPKIGGLPDEGVFTHAVPDNFAVLRAERRIIDGRTKYELTVRAEKAGDCDIDVHVTLQGETIASARYPFRITL